MLLGVDLVGKLLVGLLGLLMIAAVSQHLQNLPLGWGSGGIALSVRPARRRRGGRAICRRHRRFAPAAPRWFGGVPRASGRATRDRARDRPRGTTRVFRTSATTAPGLLRRATLAARARARLLLCVGRPVASLEDIAKQGAAALELANDYTDFIEAARRRKPTTAAAEIQQNLFPPRIARIAGAQLAGVLLPSYEVGGDWFDFVENRDGAWLAIADSAGKGPTAAGLGAAALGALRAARRSGQNLEQALVSMDETVRELGNPEFHVTALVGRWRAATMTFTWVNCGHPPAYLVNTQGELTELRGAEHTALGAGPGAPTYRPTRRQLQSGERLILLTNGITGRHMEDGTTFGIGGLRAALERAENPTAASTAMAIQQVVTDCWREPLQDDGTVVVMAIE